MQRKAVRSVRHHRSCADSQREPYRLPKKLIARPASARRRQALRLDGNQAQTLTHARSLLTGKREQRRCTNDQLQILRSRHVHPPIPPSAGRLAAPLSGDEQQSPTYRSERQGTGRGCTTTRVIVCSALTSFAIMSKVGPARGISIRFLDLGSLPLPLGAEWRTRQLLLHDSDTCIPPNHVGPSGSCSTPDLSLSLPLPEHPFQHNLVIAAKQERRAWLLAPLSSMPCGFPLLRPT